MNINYDGLEQIYNELNRVVEDLDNQITSAKEIVSKLDNSDLWEGNSYDAYKSKFYDTVTSFKLYLQQVYKINDNIKQSINRYKELDAKIMGGMM